MDIFAHFLWTFAIYFQHAKRWIAGLIGFMPDLVAFVPFTLFRVLTGSTMGGRPEGWMIPDWVYVLYAISHSLVIYLLAAFLLWYVKRDWFWLSFGWPLHIIIDTPTHTMEFFPTPILWPLSDFMVSGIGWSVGWFMLLNYGALAGVYTWLIVAARRARLRPAARSARGA